MSLGSRIKVCGVRACQAKARQAGLGPSAGYLMAGFLQKTEDIITKQV